ncbi:hypothetical protein RDWZM_004683 [Blomia tropicalis]|uniref:c-SKI SMAD4-binding domain-containing protein n=1 Tax=Blomia tropicalis TaxID=40697 RepID=A0A9Q0RLM5_BLOTA|nr:hypothetical protein RDWZM_004683 [Blomia tropicalis]
MLFGTGLSVESSSSSSTSTTTTTTIPVVATTATNSNVTYHGNAYHHQSSQPFLKSSSASSTSSFHPAALVTSMLHQAAAATSANSSAQSDLIQSFNYHHHHPHHPQHGLHHTIDTIAVAHTAPNVRMDSNGIETTKTGSTSMSNHHHMQSSRMNDDQSPSNNLSQGTTTSNGPPNEVRNVMLYGIPIVSLVMDGQERLCLAQISNTLLKNFSYNEIHNRRVALGITCVQCTPVQLELLRRAGAMPVSSRRCGMITKREAERLCKSFLAEAEPPKLPDTFAFDVYHSCAWGCRGNFTPSRYNSSRAKCIKCVYCGLFFSPNKFIFHSHRLPNSKYVQPDAANFNSWRRHIRLVSSPEPPEHVSYAWEDVKAMFNGGSRKRAMSSTLNSFTKNQENNSKSNMAEKMSTAASSASIGKYSKYVDDNNSGLDDSDECCSLNDDSMNSPVKKTRLMSNESSSNEEASSSTNNNTNATNNSDHEMDQNACNQTQFLHHPIMHPHATNYHATYISPQQQQSNNKIGMFENHLKKAFEVSTLIGKNVHETGKSSPTNKLINGIESAATIDTKNVDLLMAQSSMLPIDSYIETNNNNNNSSSKANIKQTAQPIVPSHHFAYLSHHNNHDPSSLHYNGLFGNVMTSNGGNNPLASRIPLPESRIGATHPALLSTLLGSMPTGNGQSDQFLTTATNGVQVHNDFRQNLAEFMWSMAKASSNGSIVAPPPTPHQSQQQPASTPAPPPPPPPPYNLLWHSGHNQPATISAHSSSSTSSTPNNISPSQTNGINESSSINETITNGNLFGFKSNNANDDLRKALLLNSNLLQQQQQQQRNVNLSQFASTMHHNSAMPFLPNLIGKLKSEQLKSEYKQYECYTGHNLRFIPNGMTVGGTEVASNFLLTKDGAEFDNGSSGRKTPEFSTTSNTIPTPTPFFPFRSPFINATTTGTSLDRFSSEMLAARSQFLFDAYQNASVIPNGRSLFHSNMFSEKNKFEESNESINESNNRTIDVIGDDSDNQTSSSSTFKSMYPFIYSTTKSSRKSPNSKYVRRNPKKQFLDSTEHKRKTSSSINNVQQKGKMITKKKSDDNLIVIEQVELDIMSKRNNKIISNQSEEQSARNRIDCEESREVNRPISNNSIDEMDEPDDEAVDHDQQSRESSKSSSPFEQQHQYIRGQSRSPSNSYHSQQFVQQSYGSTSPSSSSPSNTKTMFMFNNNNENSNHSRTSPNNNSQMIQLTS